MRFKVVRKLHVRCVCVFVCVYVCTCARLYMRACMCVCACTRVCVHMHTWGLGSVFTGLHSDCCKLQETTVFSFLPRRIKLSTEKLFLGLVYCLKQIL